MVAYIKEFCERLRVGLALAQLDLNKFGLVCGIPALVEFSKGPDKLVVQGPDEPMKSSGPALDFMRAGSLMRVLMNSDPEPVWGQVRARPRVG